MRSTFSKSVTSSGCDLPLRQAGGLPGRERLSAALTLAAATAPPIQRGDLREQLTTVLAEITSSHIGTSGWDLHDLRHSRLTHAGEDGATDTDLMNLSGHADRRTLQRYLTPSKEGTHRRLDEIDTHRPTWTPSTDELADRMTTHGPARSTGRAKIHR
jgi:integrase/recombinase XerC